MSTPGSLFSRPFWRFLAAASTLMWFISWMTAAEVVSGDLLRGFVICAAFGGLLLSVMEPRLHRNPLIFNLTSALRIVVIVLGGVWIWLWWTKPWDEDNRLAKEAMDTFYGKMCEGDWIAVSNMIAPNGPSPHEVRRRWESLTEFTRKDICETGLQKILPRPPGAGSAFADHPDWYCVKRLFGYYPATCVHNSCDVSTPCFTVTVAELPSLDN